MTKKLVLAVLSVVAVFAALGTTTFAWFSLTSEATIAKIDVQVEAGDGIEITVQSNDAGTPINFKPSVTIAEIETAILAEYGVKNAVPVAEVNTEFKFSAVKLTAVTPNEVTLANATTFSKYAISLWEDDDADNGISVATPNIDYIEFSLWIRVMGTEHAYWVNPASTVNGGKVLASSGVDWLASETLDFAAEDDALVQEGKTYKAYASSAARVSVGPKVYENKASELMTASSTEYGNTNITNGVIDPLIGGLQYINNRFDGSIAALATNAKAVVTIKELTEVAATATDLYVGTGEGAWTAQTGGWKLSPELKVRIWIEGWDAECFDAIYKDIISVALKFTNNVA